VNIKYKNIGKLPPEDRYIKFIADVANFESLWILEDSKGIYLLKDEKENLVMPLWSEQDLAETYKDIFGLNNCKVSRVSVHAFMDEWIDYAAQNHIKFSPLPFEKGMRVDPIKLREDLIEELGKY
jgi:hypothetical protein